MKVLYGRVRMIDISDIRPLSSRRRDHPATIQIFTQLCKSK